MLISIIKFFVETNYNEVLLTTYLNKRVRYYYQHNVFNTYWIKYMKLIDTGKRLASG